MRRLAAAATVLAALAGCGNGEDAGDRPRLTVAAATSLRDALTDYARDFRDADVKLSFAASDLIAGQIREGADPDVFVSADGRIAREVGRGDEPVTVATNRLVIAISAEAPGVRSFTDLLRPGVTLALGTPSVPIGAYADEVLARLPRAQRRQILDNVRTREPDASGVIGKVAAGAVDAGFVYETDARAAADDVLAIALPSDLQPRIEYAAVILGGGEPARRFVDGMAKAQALRDAGFGAP